MYEKVKQFADKENITYQTLGQLVNRGIPADRRVSWTRIYNVITGRDRPGKKTRWVLERFMERMGLS